MEKRYGMKICVPNLLKTWIMDCIGLTFLIFQSLADQLIITWVTPIQVLIITERKSILLKSLFTFARSPLVTMATHEYFQGCKVSMMNFVENNLLYVGIIAGVIVILQVNYILELIDSLTLVCHCSSCSATNYPTSLVIVSNCDPPYGPRHVWILRSFLCALQS